MRSASCSGVRPPLSPMIHSASSGSVAVRFEEGQHCHDREALVAVEERFTLGDAAREEGGLEAEVCTLIVSVARRSCDATAALRARSTLEGALCAVVPSTMAAYSSRASSSVR